MELLRRLVSEVEEMVLDAETGTHPPGKTRSVLFDTVSMCCCCSVDENASGALRIGGWIHIQQEVFS
jgi:hypothetical protein